ncbi:MAG: glutamate-5-semialdehyde dehydrogenase [Elusimicrobiota bacterium]
MKNRSVSLIAEKAKIASRKLAILSAEEKNSALLSIAEKIESNKDKILNANSKDVSAAKKNKLVDALIDRLTLNEKRISDICSSLKDIAKLPDPVGETLAEWTRPNGIKIKKVRVPLGVICMIYESRPNVTVDSTALCLKSGNAVVLRGGSEAINSNRHLVIAIRNGLKKTSVPQEAVQFIDTTDRSDIYKIIKMDKYIDLVIPRGSQEMVSKIRLEATVPVLSHGKGLCHTYIDKSADIEMAKNIVFNAKVQRPGVCNATESLIIHRETANSILPVIAAKLLEAKVELRADKEALKILKGYKYLKTATEHDWSTEYLGLILSVKVVGSLEQAIEHINKYGSGHSDAIITEDAASAEKFIAGVDSSAVFHNASTRLHDGGVFGLGAEIGISTQKLHARGTMGLRELTTTKYVVHGTGQTRE